MLARPRARPLGLIAVDGNSTMRQAGESRTLVGTDLPVRPVAKTSVETAPASKGAGDEHTAVIAPAFGGCQDEPARTGPPSAGTSGPGGVTSGLRREGFGDIDGINGLKIASQGGSKPGDVTPRSGFPDRFALHYAPKAGRNGVPASLSRAPEPDACRSPSLPPPPLLPLRRARDRSGSLKRLLRKARGTRSNRSSSPC